jgi:glutamate synthase domain-containing protein 1
MEPRQGNDQPATSPIPTKENPRIADRDWRNPSACGLIGIMNRRGIPFSGEVIIRGIACLRERSNGLGGGFAAYGIYPENKDDYAFHILYPHLDAKKNAEEYLRQHYKFIRDEAIPTHPLDAVRNPPILWRYFLQPIQEMRISQTETEEDFVVRTVMEINQRFPGTFVASSGKDMGIFKGVGYPEDIAAFFRLDEYQGYLWTAHGRFPTNTPGWWGGAHPFGLLDWSVVHNGEISSYGINRRYLQNYGYHCAFSTDTEVIAYLFDLLHRKHGLDFPIVAKILSAPLWDEIERMEDREFYQRLRIIYGSALLNGPFAVIVAKRTAMIGLNDRIKLRPLMAAEWKDYLYIASEESAIREVCDEPERVWAPEAGDPVIGSLEA